MLQNDLLLNRMDDLAAKAAKAGCAASRFLTPAEAQSVAAYFSRRRDVAVVFDGGYEDAERVRAIFLNPDWGEYERGELFTTLKIETPPQNFGKPLGHRDILGAVMALGIERDTLGDIIESPLVMLCLPELGDYIIENLTKAGRVGVRLSRISLDEIPGRAEELIIKTDTVASPRLDSVVSAAFSISRSKAFELIEAGRVNLNHEVCLQSDRQVGEGAVISIRGLGRVKLLEIGGLSKKGRVFIKTGLYGK